MYSDYVYSDYVYTLVLGFIYLFVFGSGFLWVGILIVYTEIPRVFWALGILFIYICVGYGVTYYTGLGDHLGIECNPFCYCPD